MHDPEHSKASSAPSPASTQTPTGRPEEPIAGPDTAAASAQVPTPPMTAQVNAPPMASQVNAPPMAAQVNAPGPWAGAPQGPFAEAGPWHPPAPPAPSGAALPYNPYGPPPQAITRGADPSHPYGPPPEALASAYPAAPYPTGRPPGPPFPGMLGFLLLVAIGFAMNVGIGAVGMLVAGVVSGASVESLSSGDFLKSVPLTAILGVLFLASLAWPGVALVGARLMREWSLSSFRLRWPGILANGMALVMGLALVPVALALEHGMSRLVPRGQNELLELMIRQPGTLAMAILGVTLVLSAPIGEELLFRGLGLRGLERRYGITVSALLVSLIFSAVHLNLTGFTALFVVSLVLCWLTNRTGSVIPSIVLHAAYNGLQFLMLAVGDHSEAALRKAMAQQHLGIPFWVVGGAAGIVALSGLVVHRFAPRPAPENATEGASA